MLDTLMLSRIQFGFVISFHILFPAFTIGLAWWLLFLEAVWLKQRTDLWRDLYFFWMKIFAVSFGLGVVSGIVMSFQFGTNWAGYSVATGNVVGPLLNYEVLTAFGGICGSGWRCRLPGSSLYSQAGMSPKSGDSPGSCTESCAPKTRSVRWQRPRY